MYANRLPWRWLTEGRYADLDVVATGLIDGEPARLLPRASGGFHAVYERD